jgi:hypothetical protein
VYVTVCWLGSTDIFVELGAIRNKTENSATLMIVKYGTISSASRAENYSLVLAITEYVLKGNLLLVYPLRLPMSLHNYALGFAAQRRRHVRRV